MDEQMRLSIEYLESEAGQASLRAWPVELSNREGVQVDILKFNRGRCPREWGLLDIHSQDDEVYCSPHEALALVVAERTARLMEACDGFGYEWDSPDGCWSVWFRPPGLDNEGFKMQNLSDRGCVLISLLDGLLSEAIVHYPDAPSLQRADKQGEK